MQEERTRPALSRHDRDRRRCARGILDRGQRLAGERAAEVDSLRQALEERKLIERAKGIVMRRDDIDEEAAYKRLRRLATDGRIRLVDAAKRILADQQKAESA